MRVFGLNAAHANQSSRLTNERPRAARLTVMPRIANRLERQQAIPNAPIKHAARTDISRIGDARFVQGAGRARSPKDRDRRYTHTVIDHPPLLQDTPRVRNIDTVQAEADHPFLGRQTPIGRTFEQERRVGRIVVTDVRILPVMARVARVARHDSSIRRGA